MTDRLDGVGAYAVQLAARRGLRVVDVTSANQDASLGQAARSLGFAVIGT